ncbi:hypothetical protein [Labrenzia sp. DG1229]|uniref:hypothetical protein n=1 Tax=Labrenzia sp. DG1229 TaxID=681847 RepID=UPI0004901EC4|nr:hypothetical protein [Labrenzia sp. DG1229]
MPEIPGGVRIGIIRAVKGIIIDQLLISIVGFWAVLIVLFALVFSVSEFLAYLERRVSYYAGKR